MITSAVYRANGGGWNEQDRQSHIWVTRRAPRHRDREGEAADFRQIFGRRPGLGAGWIADLFHLRPRGRFVFLPERFRSLCGAGGRRRDRQGREHQRQHRRPRPSPDGKWIAFNGTLYGTPERSYDQPDLFVAAADGSGTPRNLTAKYDFDIGGGVGGDQRAPRGGGAGGAIWSADGKSIVIVAGEQGSANLIRVDVATGNVLAGLLRRRTPCRPTRATPDGKTIAAVTSTGTNINDLFVLDANAGASSAKQITHINDALFKTIKLSEPELVSWTSFDGKKIEGWVLHPPDFDRSKQYPFILEIHGGPHSAYGNVFTHEFHWTRPDRG